MNSKNIKQFYTYYSDKIYRKRFKSKYLLRAYAHEMQYYSILSNVSSGTKVLDVGCGEGTLSVMMAQAGASVTGVDLSIPNIAACKSFAKEAGLDKNISFFFSDAEKLPFPDNSFDLVVSSHVLEHLPDFDKGFRELMRVTKKRAIVAIPTIVNPCSWVQIGGGWFYLKGLKSFSALFLGFLKMLLALITLQDGVNESYVGAGVPHMFRFPRVMKRKIKKGNFKLIKYEASSICLPYFEFFLPTIRFIDKFRDKPILRNFGYGTTFIIEKD